MAFVPVAFGSLRMPKYFALLALFLYGSWGCIEQKIDVENKQNLLGVVPGSRDLLPSEKNKILEPQSEKKSPSTNVSTAAASQAVKPSVASGGTQKESPNVAPVVVVGGVAPLDTIDEQSPWSELPHDANEEPPSQKKEAKPAAKVQLKPAQPTPYVASKNNLYMKNFDEKTAWEIARRLDPDHPDAIAFTAWFSFFIPVRCGGPQSSGKCHACVSQVLRHVKRGEGSQVVWPPGVMDGGDRSGKDVNAWPYARLFADVLNKYPGYLKKLSLKPIHNDIPKTKSGEPDLRFAPVGTIMVYEHGRPGHIEVITQPQGRRACSDFCSTPRNLRGKSKIIGMYIPVK